MFEKFLIVDSDLPGYIYYFMQSCDAQVYVEKCLTLSVCNASEFSSEEIFHVQSRLLNTTPH